MEIPCTIALLRGAASALVAAAMSAAIASDPIDFDRDVRPILSDNCFACHGPDAAKREADLRLDTEEGALGADGVIVPRDPESSELIARITHADADERMPPPESNLALTSAQIETLRGWIAAGAPWEGHWAFQPVAEVDVPAAPDDAPDGWPANPIDRFVLAKLRDDGMAPSPPADRARWLRRVTLDLTGLPSTAEETAAFEADREPGARERVIDRLLASTAFGERMAVDWLDAARYADTFGYQADVEMRVWPWRDWVIRAFNENLPYDEFLTQQLAGDLLPEAGRDAVVATAFNRLHRQTNEGGSVEEEFRVEYVSDRVHTFGTAVLGLTLECARCHDHKYDPISQRDYYALSAFFDNIDESGLYSHFTDATPTPSLALTTPEQDAELAALRGAAANAEAAIDALAAEREGAFQKWKASVDLGTPVPVPNVIGEFPFDGEGGAVFANRANPEAPAAAVETPAIEPAAVGDGLHLSGENGVKFPNIARFKRSDPFTIAFRMRTPDAKDRAVIVHDSRAWTDAGSRGYEILLEDGRLMASLIHFWPGDAISVRTKEAMDVGEWIAVAVTYDGSSRADGLHIFLDGKPTEVDVVRDSLTRTIQGGGGELAIGHRFRDRGFKDGWVDEFFVVGRAVSALEAKQLAGRGGAEAASDSALREYFLSAVDEEMSSARERLSAARDKLNAAFDAVPSLMVMRELPAPRTTFVLNRGAYDAPGEAVAPGVPGSLLPLPADAPQTRLGLARWVTDPRNPLAARVAVNRIWRVFLGRGLVTTPEDFGSQGQPPSHPELLDWLARDFAASGWDVKRLCRMIALSATYAQDSRVTPQLMERDPQNRFLARGPRRRLSAEQLRDQALAASGLLVRRIGGPSVKPYQPPGLWEEKSGAAYQQDHGENLYRRSLYTFVKRTSPHPAMIAFDATAREVCIARREATDTPLQALVLFNDPQFVEAARVLAERTVGAGGEPGDLVAAVLGRSASDREAAILRQLAADEEARFRADPAAADSLLGVGESERDTASDPARLAAFTVAAQAVFGFDEAVRVY